MPLNGQVLNFTLPILRLLSSKAQGRKDFWKPSKHCYVGIHWIALTEYSQMSTNMPGFQSLFSFLEIILYGPNLIATSSKRVNKVLKLTASTLFDVFLHNFLSNICYANVTMKKRVSVVYPR